MAQKTQAQIKINVSTEARRKVNVVAAALGISKRNAAELVIRHGYTSIMKDVQLEPMAKERGE